MIVEKNTEIKEIEMGRLKIVFLDAIGNPIISKEQTKIENSELFEHIKSYQWILYIDGIQQKNIKSVEIPKLSYEKSEVLTVKVEYYLEAS